MTEMLLVALIFCKAPTTIITPITIVVILSVRIASIAALLLPHTIRSLMDKFHPCVYVLAQLLQGLKAMSCLKVVS